nr:hypothetical protein [Tanacetum cinerariifolium]
QHQYEIAASQAPTSLIVEDKVHCCGFGEFHKLIEQDYGIGLGAGRYDFTPRASDGTSMLETQGQSCDLRLCVSGNLPEPV